MSGSKKNVNKKVKKSGVEELLMGNSEEIPIVPEEEEQLQPMEVEVDQMEVELPPIEVEVDINVPKIAKGVKLVPDFNEDDCMTDVEKVIDGQLCKVKLYNEKFQKKGSIARGQLRSAKAYNVSISHLSNVVDKLNGRKIDNVFINDLIGRHGFYNGSIMSRADLGRKTNTSLQHIEIATKKLKSIVKREDYARAYIEYLDFEKKLSDLSEEEKLRGGNL